MTPLKSSYTNESHTSAPRMTSILGATQSSRSMGTSRHHMRMFPENGPAPPHGFCYVDLYFARPEKLEPNASVRYIGTYSDAELTCLSQLKYLRREEHLFRQTSVGAVDARGALQMADGTVLVPEKWAASHAADATDEDALSDLTLGSDDDDCDRDIETLDRDRDGETDCEAGGHASPKQVCVSWTDEDYFYLEAGDLADKWMRASFVIVADEEPEVWVNGYNVMEAFRSGTPLPASLVDFFDLSPTTAEASLRQRLSDLVGHA